MVASGLAMPWPAMSGALPWIGSYMPVGKILLALLKNSPKIVSKKELCIRLWGTEEFIDENALQVNFTRLRKTLREFGLEERIETVRGQGYRLKEQVRL